MLNDARVSQFKKVYLAPGFTDLRRGIDGLTAIVRFQFSLDPYDKNTLFLFCGRRSDRIKALLWEGDGFLLLYKRLDNGAFRWPRSAFFRRRLLRILPTRARKRPVRIVRACSMRLARLR